MRYVLEQFAVSVSAITGVLAARGKQVDMFGVVVLALVTALGGGTIRDVVLARGPIFWTADASYLINAAVTAVIMFYLVRFHELPATVLMVADAFSLALFTILGTQKALGFQAAPAIAVAMGVTTGVAGGILRDLLIGEIPLVFRPHIYLYATAAFCGASVFVLLNRWSVNAQLNLVIGTLTALLVAVGGNTMAHRAAAFSPEDSEGFQSEITRLAFEKLTATNGADEFSIAHSDLAAYGDNARTAFNGPAFEGVVIHVHGVGLSGDGSAIIGIVDDEVGVAAGLDGSFARKQAKNFCGLRAGNIHELLEIEPVLFDAVRVENIDAVFEGGDAVGNFREVIAAHDFLGLEIERAMVGGDGIDEAGAQGVPEDWLVDSITERRRHDKFCAFEVGTFGKGFVEDKILDEGFDVDTDAAAARGKSFGECFLTTEMDDVSGRAGEFGERHQVMHALGFNGGRAAFVMPFGPGFAGGKKFPLAFRNQSFVFAMGE